MKSLKEIIDYLLTDVASKGTCTRHKVGCLVLDKEMNILAEGWNDTIGELKCHHIYKNGETYSPEHGHHRTWSLKNEIHAEVNALNKLSDDQLHNVGYILVSHSPCKNCSTFIHDRFTRNNLPVPNVLFYQEWSNSEEDLIIRNQLLNPQIYRY